MACCRKKADGERKSEICESEFSKEDLERKVVLSSGDKAPEFSLQNSDGVSVNLKDFIGKKVVCIFIQRITRPVAPQKRVNLARFMMILSQMIALLSVFRLIT